MSLFTRIGVGLWSWEPWLALEPPARLAWMGLYTTGESKRLVPGLWHGGPQVLSDATRMSFIDVQAALEEMVDKKMAEWDKRSRVIRLTMLPDDAERPSNGNCIKAWWRRFHSVPECGVRNRHIDLLKWLVGTMTKSHAEAWDTTFGTVSQHPVGRSRPTEQRMVTNQVDLFHSDHIGNRSLNGSGNPWVNGSGSGSDSDQSAGSGPTLSTADSDLSNGLDSGRARNPLLAELGEQLDPVAAISAVGESSAPPQPEAPPVAALTGRALHEALVRSGGKRYLAAYDDRLERDLGAAIRTAGAAGFGLPEVEHMGRWFAAGGEAWRGDIGPSFFARNGNLVEAIEKSRRWKVGEPITVAPRASPLQAISNAPRPELMRAPDPIPDELRATSEQVREAWAALGIVK